MASDGDAPSRSVTHTEGTSYIVAFGHPELFPITASEQFVFSPFPAAGGQNPYQPESGVMHAIYTEMQEVGQSWTIHSVPPPSYAASLRICYSSSTTLSVGFLRGAEVSNLGA